MTVLARIVSPHTPIGFPATPALAALSMYDLPELQSANDELWGAIASRLRAAGVVSVPDRLSRGLDLDDLWSSPDLLLAQTCGYPLITRLRGKVQLVATPSYLAPGCEGPFRRSAIVVRAGASVRGLADLRGARCALNDRTSDSGMNLLRAEIAPLADARPFFSEVRITGSHLASAIAVAEGEADVAAIDAVTFAHLRALRPGLTRELRVLQWSARGPGLPLITSADASPATVRALQAALAAVAQDPALSKARERLLLKDFSPLPLHYYALTRHHEERAQHLGYPILS